MPNHDLLKAMIYGLETQLKGLEHTRAAILRAQAEGNLPETPEDEEGFEEKIPKIDRRIAQVKAEIAQKTAKLPG